MWNLKNKTTNKTETEPTDTKNKLMVTSGKRGRNEEQDRGRE